MPPDAKPLRAFVAVEFSPATRLALGRLVERLAATAPARAVNWVKPELFHLTLKFLGDTPEDAVPGLTAALMRVAASLTAFRVTTGGLGAFPNLKRPRVLWLGLHAEPANGLTVLAAGIDSALSPLGYLPEGRPFSPHLTLGRIRREATPAQAALAGQALSGAAAPLPLIDEIASVALMKSDLRRSGPVYTPLRQARLGAGPDSLPGHGF